MSAQHTPGPAFDHKTAVRFLVKRNWAGSGFVLLDGLTVIAKHDTKRAAVAHRLAAISKATGSAT